MTLHDRASNLKSANQVLQLSKAEPYVQASNPHLHPLLRRDSPGSRTLNRSFGANGASWRTYYLLATARLKKKEWAAAASAAVKSANVAHGKVATPLLLGDIQLAAGEKTQAKQTWEKLISTFPNDPLAGDAKNRTAQADSGQGTQPTEMAAIALPAEAVAVEASVGATERGQPRLSGLDGGVQRE